MTRRSKAKKVAAAASASLFLGAIIFISACKRAETNQTSQAATIQPVAVSYVPLNFEPTPARIERGRYIVEGVAHCFMCHSEVDWSKPGAQPVLGKKGAGTRFPEEALSSFLIAPNITPDRATGAGDWSNEMIARAIREGIGHDGRRLFPLMPYMNFRQMSDEDLVSVVSYIRTIKPVTNKLPDTKLPEEIKGVLPPPQPIAGPVAAPDMGDMVKRGEYLVALGNCTECHTARGQNGQPLPGLELGGGGILEGPWGRVASANITPDASGIPYYDEALFIQVLRTGTVKARKLNSVMPWGYFRNMTDDDLKAIFAYLKTLKPVKHTVDNAEPATHCKICGGMHGGGEFN